MAKRQIAIFVLGPSALPIARKIKDTVRIDPRSGRA